MDISNLEEKLANLRGLDLEMAEIQERSLGNNALEISITKSYQARLAAMALGVPVNDIKELPAKKYFQICARVFTFLNVPSEDETPSTK